MWQVAITGPSQASYPARQGTDLTTRAPPIYVSSPRPAPHHLRRCRADGLTLLIHCLRRFTKQPVFEVRRASAGGGKVDEE